MDDMEELGVHVVVVDAISDDNQQVRLRDPWHGWEITVKADAFLKRYNGRETLQIKARESSVIR